MNTNTMLDLVEKYLREFLEVKGYPPMKTEIAEACQFDLRHVELALDLLEVQERIRRTPAIRLVSEGEQRARKLVLRAENREWRVRRRARYRRDSSA